MSRGAALASDGDTLHQQLLHQLGRGLAQGFVDDGELAVGQQFRAQVIADGMEDGRQVVGAVGAVAAGDAGIEFRQPVRIGQQLVDAAHIGQRRQLHCLDVEQALERGLGQAAVGVAMHAVVIVEFVAGGIEEEAADVDAAVGQRGDGFVLVQEQPARTADLAGQRRHARAEQAVPAGIAAKEAQPLERIAQRRADGFVHQPFLRAEIDQRLQLAAADLVHVHDLTPWRTAPMARAAAGCTSFSISALVLDSSSSSRRRRSIASDRRTPPSAAEELVMMAW